MILPGGAEEAAEALGVERSLAIRRALNEARTELTAGRLSPNETAERIVAVVRDAGLRPVTLEDLPEPVEVDDLGVVCWIAVLPSAPAG